MLDGITAPELISKALAPGVSLTALILYNTSLQNRFVYITGRIRELDREARALRAADPAQGAARLASLRAQVDLMLRRSRSVRRAVLLVYGAFASTILTVFALAGSAIWPSLDHAALVTFTGGFAFVGAAALISAREMFLALRTVVEDIESSFGKDG